MTVVPIHAPGLNDAVGISIFARAADVIDNPIAAAGAGLAHLLRDFIECLFPGNAFPLAFAAFAHALKRIQNPFGVIDLVMGRRTFGAVSSAAAWVDRIAFEFANLKRVFVHVGEQTTG